ncbi:NHLP bacteriocin system secretion protein [Synechococcus sp. CS-1324]|uniref:NHLP bacteriocin system secretion protein n=2 Tax=Synechococcus TaxID=1129 RepID=UPI000DB7030C|nr:MULTISPECIES: NHLP bacteriocin system secretion protein [unclassified Synechococcus]MCT0214280.1 NHLP bacteriocin system secretion protein [Synechococcus sp. CS-1326]MCT0230202.1 NHLP bacteriocin system secretion protein [Synechococcus sp. CS-1324]MCT0234444.1 NHLP bacteriocin system secretion protein [Synechococcus sp. CS-1327]PZV05081.1 MAG: NHLP bacteriocin system secretion protein [Cyanobium sp.]
MNAPLPTARKGLTPHQQVGCSLGAMAGALVLWACFWAVPTEVVGKGVLLLPDNAGLLDARAGGQVRRLHVAVGDRVRRGQVLIAFHLPVLERQLEQQRANLRELERQDLQLSGRDRLRLLSEKEAVDTALAKLAADRGRFGRLKGTYSEKLSNLDWLAQRDVVAPLSTEVVAVEQGLTSTGVSLDQVRIEEKRLLTSFQQVRLSIETEALQRRFRIDDLRRQLRVTEAQLGFDGRLHADRDGVVLDLQVIPGQTVAVGQRLGTIGRDPGAAALRAIAYFAPADARRLRDGLPVEVVPDWNQRGRFGGIVGKVKRVNVLPATEADISTTIGNPQLAKALVEAGPVMRAEIGLERDPGSVDGYRWTLSQGSRVFPVREGLTTVTHAYVEWRTPLSYVLPGLRNLTGGFRGFDANPGPGDRK